jgi:uncharacterized OsmC-like protein
MSDKINGIDKTRLSEMINAVKAQPSLAKFIFRVNNTWMEGGHSRSVLKGFYGAEREDDSRALPFIFDIDQPLSLLGGNNGPTGVEYLLNAVAGCLTNSIVCLSAARGIALTDIESEVTGQFDLRYMFGLTYDKENILEDIKIKFRIKGKGLSFQDKQFLCDLGKKTSIVYKMITTTFPVNISVVDEFVE